MDEIGLGHQGGPVYAGVRTGSETLPAQGFTDGLRAAEERLAEVRTDTKHDALFLTLEVALT
jgi:hypothetical protein